MIQRLYNRLHDLRNAQSNATTPEQRAKIQAEIISLLQVIDQIERN